MQAVCWLSIIFVGLLGCISSPIYSSVTEDPNPVDARLVSANNSFGFKLFEKLVEQSSDENVFISPTSLAIALSMTYNGANGKTQQAMAKALEIQGLNLAEVNQASAALMEKFRRPGADIRLDMANSLWAQEGEGFRQDFLRQNEEFYQAGLKYLDFSDPMAPSVISAWVKEKTNGKIENMVESIPGGVILYLINAVYFKGVWGVEFSKEHTRERDFTLLDDSKKKVLMMMAGSKAFSYLRGENFDAVGLPYGDGKVSMYVFVPHRESSLKKLYTELNAGSWEDWISQFHQQSELIVIMPRLNLEYQITLNSALTDLGMGVAFNSGAADFSRMCSGKVWIDEVKQKTYLEVNEEGTEAAAATSVRMSRGPRAIYADRPFFCAIRDNETRAILFMGSIVEP